MNVRKISGVLLIGIGLFTETGIIVVLSNSAVKLTTVGAVECFAGLVFLILGIYALFDSG